MGNQTVACGTRETGDIDHFKLRLNIEYFKRIVKKVSKTVTGKNYRVDD